MAAKILDHKKKLSTLLHMREEGIVQRHNRHVIDQIGGIKVKKKTSRPIAMGKNHGQDKIMGGVKNHENNRFLQQKIL